MRVSGCFLAEMQPNFKRIEFDHPELTKEEIFSYYDSYNHSDGTRIQPDDPIAKQDLAELDSFSSQIDNGHRGGLIYPVPDHLMHYVFASQPQLLHLFIQLHLTFPGKKIYLYRMKEETYDGVKVMLIWVGVLIMCARTPIAETENAEARHIIMA